MANPHLTKLRLSYERRKRQYEEAKREKEEAWLEYLRTMREYGLCANCERALNECHCVFLASVSAP